MKYRKGGRKTSEKWYDKYFRDEKKEIDEKYIVAIFLIVYLIVYFIFFAPKNVNIPVKMNTDDVIYKEDYSACLPEALKEAGFGSHFIVENYRNKNVTDYCRQHINFTISKDATWNSIVDDSGYDWKKLTENPTDDGYAIMAAISFLTVQDSNSDFDGIFTQRMLDSENRNSPEELASLGLRPVGGEMTKENTMAIINNLRVLNDYYKSKLNLSIYNTNSNRIDFLEEYFKALEFKNGCLSGHCKDDIDSSGVSSFIANSFSFLSLKQNRNYHEMGQIVKIEDFGRDFIIIKNMGREDIDSDNLDFFIDMGTEYDVNYIECTWNSSLISPNQTASCRFRKIIGPCNTMAINAPGNRNVINCSSLN